MFWKTLTTSGHVRDTIILRTVGESDPYVAQYGANNVTAFNYICDKLSQSLHLKTYQEKSKDVLRNVYGLCIRNQDGG